MVPRPPHIDLHTHTDASDGVASPAEVVQLAADRGVSVLAVTDHDTVAGLDEAIAAGERLGVEVVPGVEVSTYHRESVHVVGLFVDPASRWVRGLTERRYKERRRRIDRICELLREVGVVLDPDAVRARAGNGSVGRPHVARALVEAGMARDVDDAFERYIGRGRPAYVPTGRLTVPEAVAGLHESGALAILAHPGMYRREMPIREWAEAGLDGIEVVHPHHDEADEARFRALAAELSLPVSGGTDYHGDGTTRAALPGSLGVSEAELAALRRRHRTYRGTRWES